MEITHENYIATLRKVESEIGKELDDIDFTLELFHYSLKDYEKEFNEEITDLNYFDWLEEIATNYILYDL